MGKQKIQKKSVGKRSPGERTVLALIFLLLLAALFFALIFAFRWLDNFMFSGNPVFALREFTVKNGIFWGKHVYLLESKLGARAGDNLFSESLSPSVLRKKLLSVPGIEKAEVSRRLPDTLEVWVLERVPVAQIAGSGLVVDEHCVLIRRNESMAEKQLLPVITGLPRCTVKPGDRLNNLAPALGLLAAAREFPDFNMDRLDVSELDAGRVNKSPAPVPGSRITAYMQFRELPGVYTAVFPSNGNPRLLLAALDSAIISACYRGDDRRNFDLTFDGQVVQK